MLRDIAPRMGVFPSGVYIDSEENPITERRQNSFLNCVSHVKTLFHESVPSASVLGRFILFSGLASWGIDRAGG